MTHTFANSDKTKFDSNCSVCDGKHRDSVHHEATTTLVESCKPFQVRASCGHVVIRKMREATAGVAYSPDIILDAPNGRACAECEAKAQPVRSLECCVCGAETRGRQWYNRDTGYGICPPCIEFVKKHGETTEEIRSNYGDAGIHYSASEETQQ